MLKIPDVAAYLKRCNHTKKQSAETLLAQIGEFYLQTPPYKTPYTSQVNTPLSWWKACIPTPPYLQLLAIKLFQLSHMQLVVRGFGQFVNGWLEKEERDY